VNSVEWLSCHLWVVEEWNDDESNHSCSSCQVTRGIAISFFKKTCLVAHLIPSNRSLCICPNEGIRFAFIHPTSNDGLCGAQDRE
jgi:hypothetical protein